MEGIKIEERDGWSEKRKEKKRGDVDPIRFFASSAMRGTDGDCKSASHTMLSAYV
jgi:hypothetical protein